MAKDDHGSASTYTNHGCRCDECRKAATERCRAYMARNPRQRARKSVYSKEYYRRPENKERLHAKQKAAHIKRKSDPALVARDKAYHKEYAQRPYAKESDAERKRKRRAQAWLEGRTTENRIRKRIDGRLVTVGYKGSVRPS